ncbi:MAG: Radial spoke head protein 3, partial [Paramarteilia canceri]
LSEAEKSQREVSRSVKRYNKFIENNIKSRKNSSINLKKNELYTQTETYLEEILAHPIEESQYCQTEIEHDRPPSPLFIPKKSGIDAETQILDGEVE